MRKEEGNTIIEFIRDVNEYGEEHYGRERGDFSHSDYMKKCEKRLHKFLSTYLIDAYLFSTLSFKDKRKGHIVNFADPIQKYKYSSTSVRNIFQETIQNLLSRIEDGSSFSLTIELLKSELGPDIFFEGHTNYSSPIKLEDRERHKDTIWFVPLHQMRLNMDINLFKKIEQNKEVLDFFSDVYNIDPDKSAVLLWHYCQMRNNYKNKYPRKDFIVHFLRPAFIKFNHNLLLSLSTNRCLLDEELSIINLLIYKITSLMAFEEEFRDKGIKEKEKYSLRSHSLKTFLKNQIEPNINDAVDELNGIEENHYLAKDLKEDYDYLYSLTGISSLLDKIKDKTQFLDSGEKDDLLSHSSISININEITNYFNDRTKGANNNTIIIVSETDESKLKNFSLKLYNMYMDKPLLKTLMFTILENVYQHGLKKTIQSGNGCYVELNVSLQNENEWIFSNEMNPSNPYYHDESSFTGNLLLFSKLFKETKSGSFKVSPIENTFKITIKNE